MQWLRAASGASQRGVFRPSCNGDKEKPPQTWGTERTEAACSAMLMAGAVTHGFTAHLLPTLPGGLSVALEPASQAIGKDPHLFSDSGNMAVFPGIALWGP